MTADDEVSKVTLLSLTTLHLTNTPPPSTIHSSKMAETSIVQRLRGFRDGLLVLKEDRTTYIRSADVLVNYNTLCELHEAVESQFGALDSGSEKSSEQLDGTR